MGRRPIETEYRLEKAQYMSTLWYIRRYPQLIQRREEILEGSAAPADGMPRGSGVGDPTLRKAAMLEDISRKLKPIEAALLLIPAEYQRGVFENIVYRKPYPDHTSIGTWKLWRQRYIYYVSEFLE